MREPDLIFTAADERYLAGALVALATACENSPARECALVTSAPESPLITPRIHRWFSDRGSCLRVVSLDDIPVAMMRGASDRFPIEAFVRYFPDYVSPTARRALYIDCDVVVLRSLLGLGRFLSAKAILAAEDIQSIAKGKPFLGHQRIGLPRSQRYYQTGVLLIDVPKFLAANIREKVRAVLAQRTLPFPDQDALNIVAPADIELMPPRYNTVPFLWRMSSSAHRKLTVVAHFVGGSKPWNGNRHKLPRDLLDYFDETARALGLPPSLAGERGEWDSTTERWDQILYTAAFWFKGLPRMRLARRVLAQKW